MSIGFRKVDPSTIPNAPAGRVIFFTDLNGLPQYKDENGNITTFTGPPGETGANGQGFNWRGTWSAAATYNAYDMVSNNGGSWVALASNTNSAPASGNANWSLSAAQGAPGAAGAGFNPRGTYSNANTYAPMDVALFGGSSWLALIEVAAGVGIAPGSNPAVWQLIAQIGNTGPQGPSGVNSFPTYAAAVAAEATIGQGTFVFVLADESIDGGPSTYVWDGTNLNYVVTS
jgi:hypothetical protein